MRKLLPLLLLAACASEGKDYDASARCQAQGLRPGTLAYDHCVSDEQATQLLERQRREFEDMQRERRDQQMRRY